MTLRARLFLFFGTFIAVLVLAQWWLLQFLSQDLDKETEFLAMSVGASVAQVLTVDVKCEPGESCFEVIEMSGAEHGILAVDGTPPVGIAPETHVIEWHQGGSREELKETLLEQLGDSEQVERLIGDLTHGPVVDSLGEADPSTTVRMKVVQTNGERQIHEEILGPSGDPDVRLHVGHDSGARVLRVERPNFVAQVPIPEREQPLNVFRRRLLLGSGLFALIGLLLAAVLADRVSAPLRRLSAAAAQVGDGALGTQVDERTGDREIRGTLQAFNRMSSRLEELDSETRRLEAVKHMGEMGDVARGLAHTLRNPLNALGLSVEELARPQARSEAEPERAGLVETARRQIRRIDRGIRSFLLLAGQGSESDEMPVEPVDVASLLEDVALEALQDLNGRARLQVTVEEGLDTRRSAVEPELRAVIQALVVNALEADPDGDAVQARLAASEGSEDRLLLTVEDRGPGLPERVREHLFTPHLTTKPNGSGMGLFLAHRIATHRYDGRLELIDREGGGLRVELEIDHRRPPAMAEATEETP